MKKLSFLTFIAMLFISMSSCSNNSEPEPPRSPSYRDGVYSGDNLTITIDGTQINGVSANVVSNQREYEGEIYDDHIVLNPDYDMQITLSPFPAKKQSLVLTTIMYMHSDFSGETEFGGKKYRFIGKFEGSPLGPHDEETCQIDFTSK